MPTNNTVMDLGFAADDFEAAAQWFLVAVNEGNTCAQYNLCHLYSKGRGVEQNMEQAVNCCGK